jgi:hypothetical protein
MTGSMRNNPLRLCLMIAGAAVALQSAVVGQPPINYDEDKVPPYVLPDPLVTADGRRVADGDAWRHRRREVLGLFERHVYGKPPQRPRSVWFKIRSTATDALGGKATRTQVTISLTARADGPKMDLLMYLPNSARKPVPVFLGLNFHGNHTIHPDPGIAVTRAWVRNDPTTGVTDHRATGKSRGCYSRRWPVELILARGYGLATVYYGDIEPDFPDGWKTSLRAAFGQQGKDTVFKPDEWGAIGAWAWGLSRAMDYLEQDAAVDAKRVAVLGHSRLGKTALWAGAQDERFSLVISNESGCGGAALSMRRFGETVESINRMVPYWFCGNFKQFGGHEERLPVDQHLLIALMAPRPVYVASATEDRWADPRGEFLAARGADPVYRLLGTDGLAVAEMPPPEQPVRSTIGYHLRRGKHDLTQYDWRQYLDFADRHMRR